MIWWRILFCVSLKNCSAISTCCVRVIWGGDPNVADVTIYSDPLPGLNYNSWTYNSTLEGNEQKEETNRRSNPLTKRHVKCTEREMFPNVYCHPPKCTECSKRREPFESLNVHWMTLIVQYSA